MKKVSEKLDSLVGDLLDHHDRIIKYTDTDVFNATLVFSSMMFNRTWEVMEFDKMPMEEREKMATKLGEDMRKMVYTYTGVDTHGINK